MTKFAHILFGLALTGLAMNAHALCVKPNGLLDDTSIPPGSVVMDMVPSCDAATIPAGGQLAAAPKNEASKAAGTSLPKKIDGKS